MKLVVGLRHDVDSNFFGLRRGLPKVVEIERRFGVRSTIFVRARIVKSKEDIDYLRELEEEGWEIGLHLDNTINTPNLPLPDEELRFLREEVGVKIYGVAPHGGLIGWKEGVTWKVMDSLGLDYMEGYGSPPPSKTKVIPNHISFDIGPIRIYGDGLGYHEFKRALEEELKSKNMTTVLTHPEWFVLSVGLPYKNPFMDRLTKILLTMAKKRMMGPLYQKFLEEYKGKVEFLRYIDLLKFL